MTYNFSPNPSDIYDLDHHYAYTWGIRWTPKAGEFITGAWISFNDIYNWAPEANDQLYLHLLDDTPEGVLMFWDDQDSSSWVSFSGSESIAARSSFSTWVWSMTILSLHRCSSA